MALCSILCSSTWELMTQGYVWSLISICTALMVILVSLNANWIAYFTREVQFFSGDCLIRTVKNSDVAMHAWLVIKFWCSYACMVSDTVVTFLKGQNWYTRTFTALVRKEIADETDRATGRTKQISTVPIYLSIYSPNGMVKILAIYLYYLSRLYYSASVLWGFGCSCFNLRASTFRVSYWSIT
jgi:hypothetical protein